MSFFGSSILPRRRRAAATLAALLALTGLARAEPIISEFMASNNSAYADDDGAYSDWIEIHNPDTAPASLAGWFLTDNAAKKTKWAFPAVTVPAGGYLVVFASGKDRRDPANPLHTNFSLDADGEYLALVRPDGTSAVTELAPAFPAQLANVAYGYAATASGRAREMSRLRKPTPGTANTNAGATLDDEVTVSRESGVFAQEFSLVLGSAGGAARIRYVTVPVSDNGALILRDPTAASPLYTGPIAIAESVIIRAAVFSGDDSAQGPTRMVHYEKLVTTGPQRADTFTSALPVVLLTTHGYGTVEDYDAPIPGWIDLFAPSSGAGVFTAPPGTTTFGTIAVRGHSSALFPKKGYNLDLLDDTAGEKPLALLGLGEADNWSLVAPWSYDRAGVRSAFVYAVSNAIGRWAPRTRFVEMFLDGDGALDAGDYRGVAVLTERIKIAPNRLDLAKLEPQHTAAPEITGGYLLKIDVPDVDEWGFVTEHGVPSLDSAAVVVAAPKAAKLPQAQRDYIRGYVQQMENALLAGRDSGWRDRSYQDFLDLPSWVDHHLLQVFSGNIDAFAHSDYFSKDRGGRIVAGPVWDFDRALGSYDPRAKNWDSWDAGPVDAWGYGWYGILARDPEFQQAWADRWQRLRTGELATAALHAQIDALAADVTPDAAARDAARWSDNVSPTGQGFAGEIARLKEWIANRAAWIDRQWVAAPARAESGAELVFTAPAGAVLAYTLDGSDPRALGGGLAPGALLSAGPLRVAASANLHVRSYDATQKNAFPGSPFSAAVGSSASSPLAPRARLINISARSVVGSGENALIAGVVVADTTEKRYLARGIGPALTLFGASGAVLDPQLSLFNSGGTEIARNNGWERGAEAAALPALAQSVGAFPLSAGASDSALAVQLASAAYTLQITTPSGQEGIGLAELYELDAHGRTANLSARAQVRAGSGVLIGGFVVQGPAYQRMLVRAAGPTLRTFGLETALADPVLTLNSGASIVGQNDRWGAAENAAALEAARTSVGAFAFASGSEDAALLITLPPGAYTVEVRGKNNAEGVALLEIYAVP